jgi:hypothetical protein
MTEPFLLNIRCYYPVTGPAVTPPLSIDRGVTGGGVANE